LGFFEIFVEMALGSNVVVGVVVVPVLAVVVVVSLDVLVPVDVDVVFVGLFDALCAEPCPEPLVFAVVPCPAVPALVPDAP
jgi:hypothetical protein